MMVDFDALQTKLVLEGLITQFVLPLDKETQELKKGSRCRMSFGGIPFKDYCLEVCKVSKCKLGKLSFQDLFKQGFLYRPFFEEFMQEQGYSLEDSVVKADFRMVERKED